MTDASAAEGGDYLDIGAIQQIIPHRYPFLLIDRMQKVFQM